MPTLPRALAPVYLVLAVLALVGAGRAAAQVAPVVSSADFALSGSILTPTDPCRPGVDRVTLTGKIHVLTLVQFPVDPLRPASIRILVNLADVSGVGESDILYHATGASKALTQAIPSDLYIVALFSGDFDLVPAAACGLGTVTVSAQLVFNPDGQLYVPPCTDNVPCTSFGFGDPD